MKTLRTHGWLVALAALLWLAPELLARVGGGGGYSGGGGGGGSSGGGGGGGEIIWLILQLCIHYPYIGLPVMGVVFWVWILSRRNVVEPSVVAPRPKNLEAKWNGLRKLDPNFSVVLFRDFAYSIFAKLHEARGEGRLKNYGQFLSDGARGKLQALAGGNGRLSDVQGVIVGGLQVVSVKIDEANRQVSVGLRYDANYTEVAGKRERGIYTQQMWWLQRRVDVLSPTPEKITSLECAGCGSPVETAPDGTCQHCGGRYERGEHHWYVSNVMEYQRRRVGPPLSTSAVEVGTDLPTVYAANLDRTRERFLADCPGYNQDRTFGRFQHVFNTLQSAWSQRDLEAIRPFETDNLFQNHRYCIEEYQRQKLRNVLDDVLLEKIQVVKIRSDKFYDAITCRMRASVKDYTVDEAGNVVCGSRRKVRRFTEYWTFVRGRGVAEAAHDDVHCPNCGAELKISMTGICEYCESKVTSGRFDWVLSEIQQDEEYTG